MTTQFQLNKTDTQILSDVMAPLRRVANTVPPEQQQDALERLCEIQEAKIVRRYR